MAYKEEDFLMISGIQHFIFCRRQWALIHVEQQWEENFFTVDGEQKHERADQPEIHEKRGDTISIRALRVKSNVLGITGMCDVVELRKSEDGICFPQYDGNYSVIPVEYKRGKPKENNSDKLQLMAEAYCLEEMLEMHISKGYIFYFETKRREEVILADDLRQEMTKATEEMHSYMERGYTPKVRTGKKCKTCSLRNICLPVLNKKRSVKDYIQGRVVE